MDMSAAALPPRLPSYSDAEAAHPLFPLYMKTRRSRIQLMIDCEDFADWLACYERELRINEAARHPGFPGFQRWMQDNQGGTRRCPAGNSFPHNFFFWLAGGRW